MKGSTMSWMAAAALFATLLLFAMCAVPAHAQNYNGIVGGMVEITTPGIEPVVEQRRLGLASAADEVWVQVVNPSDIFGEHKEKGAIRINGGAWQPLTRDNGNIECDPFYVDLVGGCFGWEQNVFSFILKNAGLKAGDNLVEFRLTPQWVSQNIRYRAFDPWKGGKRVAVTQSMATEPIVSVSPSGDVDRGRAIYDKQQALILHAGGPPQIAACRSCHPYESEFKHWGFTDKSIANRAQFHGLTLQQGIDIAAMVRASRHVNDDGTVLQRVMTPADPPYQPAMGISEGTSGEWLLGAGLDAVSHGVNARGQWTTPTVEQNRACIYPYGLNYSEWTNPSSPNDKCDNFQWIGLHQTWPILAPEDFMVGGPDNPDVKSFLANEEKALSAYAAGDDAQLFKALENVAADAKRIRTGNMIGSGFDRIIQRHSAVKWATWRFVQLSHHVGGSTLWRRVLPWKTKMPGFQLTGANRGIYFDDGSHIVENKNQEEPYYYGSDNGFGWYSFLDYHQAMRLNAGLASSGINATNPVDIGYTLMFAGNAHNGYLSTLYLVQFAQNQLNCPTTEEKNAGTVPGHQCAGIRQSMYAWWWYEILIDDGRFGGKAYGLPPADKARFLAFDIKYRAEVMQRWGRHDYVRSPYHYLDDTPKNERAQYAGNYKPLNHDAQVDKDGKRLALGQLHGNQRYQEPQMLWAIRKQFDNIGVACSAIDAIGDWGRVVYPATNWDYSCSGNPWPGVEDAPGGVVIEPDPDPDPVEPDPPVDPPVDPDPVDPAPVDSQETMATWSRAGDVVTVVPGKAKKDPNPAEFDGGVRFYGSVSGFAPDPPYTVSPVLPGDTVIASWFGTGRQRWARYVAACAGSECGDTPPADSTQDAGASWSNISEGDTKPRIEPSVVPDSPVCFFVNTATLGCDDAAPFEITDAGYEVLRTDEFVATWTSGSRKFYSWVEAQCPMEGCDDSEPQPDPEPDPRPILVEVGTDTLYYTIGGQPFAFVSALPDTVEVAGACDCDLPVYRTIGGGRYVVYLNGEVHEDVDGTRSHTLKQKALEHANRVRRDHKGADIQVIQNEIIQIE